MEALSTSPWQFNLIDRTLNYVTLVLKINAIDQASENSEAWGEVYMYIFFFSESFSSLLCKASQRASSKSKGVTQKMSHYIEEFIASTFPSPSSPASYFPSAQPDIPH